MNEPPMEHTSEPNPAGAGNQPVFQAWGTSLTAVLCEKCDAIFLAPQANDSIRCPQCYQGELSVIGENETQLPRLYPPEKILPLRLSDSQLQQVLDGFTRGIPFAPQDLVPGNLLRRARRLFLPVWLVDVQVQAGWQAEMGFNYQVVSHQDQFDQNRGGWRSQQVEEQRIRWEARLGSLDRSYENVSAPALENQVYVNTRLGGFDLDQAQAYTPQVAQQAFLRMPDRSPKDVWPDVLPRLQALAADECHQASGADHIRQFSWSPEFAPQSVVPTAAQETPMVAGQNWSMLFQPAITTYYLDDERKPCVLYINGQTGRISGGKRASMQRASRTTLALLATAFVIFLAGLLAILAGALAPFLAPLGAIAMTVALALGLGSVIPLVTVWGYNQSQKSR